MTPVDGARTLSLDAGTSGVWFNNNLGTTTALARLTVESAGSGVIFGEASVPEPDAAVIRAPVGAGHPQADQAALVVEVSDTTLEYDMTAKAALYASAGIPEYWVIDLNERVLYAHRQPVGGAYTEIVRYAADESVAPLARPNAPVVVADLLPKA